MKRLLCAILLLVASVALFGADKDDFDGVVDFQATLESLARQAARQPEALVQNEAVLILDGVVSAVSVLNSEPESFRAEIDLVTGEWVGLERIVMYKAVVQVAGPDFAPRIPTRRSRGRAPGGVIERNQRVVVVGTITGVADDPQTGRTIPVLEAFYVRNLD